MAEKKGTKKKEEVKKDIKKVENKASQKKIAKQIDRNEMIPCKNVVDNGVLYISPRTGLRYEWGNYGDIEYVEFGELLTMKSVYPKFLTEPWIVPESEDVIEKLKLNEIYDNLIPLDNLENFFRKQLKEIQEVIKKAPSGNKKALAIKARKMIEDETLNNYQIIKLLEKELDVDLKILMD